MAAFGAWGSVLYSMIHACMTMYKNVLSHAEPPRQIIHNWEITYNTSGSVHII